MDAPIRRRRIPDCGTRGPGTVEIVLFLLRPRWLAVHAFVVAASVAMVELGRWQWHVAAQRHNDIRNYAYAVQWWLFVAFTVLFWARVIRDARRAGPGTPGVGVEASARAVSANTAPAGADADQTVTATPQYRAYAMPQSAAIVVDDPELAAYNAYLSAFAQPAHRPTGNTRPAVSHQTGQDPAVPGVPAPTRSTARGRR